MVIAHRFRDGSKVRCGMAFMMVFFRSFFGLVFFAPWLIRQGLAPLRTRHIALHGARSGLHVATALFFFTALTLAPLAKVMAL
jgi:drug/metabolite transporter (DMT)-like permease